MAVVMTSYAALRGYILNRTIHFDTDTFKLALLADTYAPSSAHAIWGDVSAHEVAAGSGYTTGGETVGSTAVTAGASSSKFDGADVTWTALTKTFRYGVLYANVTRDTVVNPLVGYILFDNTPANIVVSGVNWTVEWSAAGIFTVS